MELENGEKCSQFGRCVINPDKIEKRLPSKNHWQRSRLWLRAKGRLAGELRNYSFLELLFSTPGALGPGVSSVPSVLFSIY